MVSIVGVIKFCDIGIKKGAFWAQEDAINVEAIACIGMNHFYADQPELSLRFYRRLLQMGINNAELFNNLGLCCFYAQQYDMSLACMERALSLAEEDTLGKEKTDP